MSWGESPDGGKEKQVTEVTILPVEARENEIKRYRDEVKEGRLVPPKNHHFEVEIVQVDGSVFPYPGRLTFAAPPYSAQTGTFLLRASVNNPAGELRPNQFVRARLKGSIRPKSITIPQRAIQRGVQGAITYGWSPKTARPKYGPSRQATGTAMTFLLQRV